MLYGPLRLERIGGATALLLVLGLPVQAGVVDLGAASQYAVLGLRNTQVTISGSTTTVNGDVGLGQGGQASIESARVLGGVFYHPSDTIEVQSTALVTDGTTPQSMSQVTQAATVASQTAAGLAPTATYGSLGLSNFTLNRTGDVSVVNVTNHLDVSNGTTLTLQGGASDVFIVNVGGTFNVAGGSRIALAGGLTAANVLFNITGSDGDINLTGGSTINGTILAANRKILASGVTVNGELIAGDQLTVQGGPTTINHQAFSGASPVPEPASVGFMLVAAGLLLARRRRR